VRFLFRDADLGQIIDQHFGLDFQLTGQFIDSDLIRVSHSDSGKRLVAENTAPQFLRLRIAP
jgi:hypothetical protein